MYSQRFTVTHPESFRGQFAQNPPRRLTCQQVWFYQRKKMLTK